MRYTLAYTAIVHSSLPCDSTPVLASGRRQRTFDAAGTVVREKGGHGFSKSPLALADLAVGVGPTRFVLLLERISVGDCA